MEPQKDRTVKCELCDIVFKRSYNYDEHLKSQRHKAKHFDQVIEKMTKFETKNEDKPKDMYDHGVDKMIVQKQEQTQEITDKQYTPFQMIELIGEKYYTIAEPKNKPLYMQYVNKLKQLDRNSHMTLSEYDKLLNE